MTSPHVASYSEQDVLNASPEQLVGILYEIGTASVIAARECNSQKDIMGRTKHVNKVFAVLVELQNGLNFETGGTVATFYAGRYDYCQKRLLEANVTQSDEILAEVQAAFEDFSQTWKTMTAGAAGLLPVPAVESYAASIG